MDAQLLVELIRSKDQPAIEVWRRRFIKQYGYAAWLKVYKQAYYNAHKVDYTFNHF